MISSFKWKTIEIECSDFKGFNIEDLNAQFRCEQPVLLVYKFKYLSWTGIVKIAPLDHMLAATESDPYQIFRQLSTWGKSLIEDEEVYKNFNKELKSMGLKKEVPHSFFGTYAGYSAYLGKASKSFKPFQSHYTFRIAGICLPDEFTPLMIDYYQRQLEQFGDLEFCSVAEGFESSKKAFKIKIDHFPKYKDADVMNHPFNPSWQPDLYESEIERLADVVRLIDKIKNMLEQKKLTGCIELDMFYHYRVRPAFFMTNVEQVQVGEFEWSKEDVELCGLRARLLRELAWPQAYKHLMVSKIKGWILKMDETHPMIRMAGTYNFVDEMTAYFKETAERYPVLFENPLVDLV